MSKIDSVQSSCAIVYENNGVLEIAREVHINVFPRIQ